MKYAIAFYKGLCAAPGFTVSTNALVACAKAELVMISLEVSLMLPNQVSFCWHGRTLVVHDNMKRTLGLARMEVAPDKGGWPVCIAWSGEKLYAHTMDALCEVLRGLLTNPATARVVAFAAAVPGVALTQEELDLAEKSVERPELFKQD